MRDKKDFKKFLLVVVLVLGILPFVSSIAVNMSSPIQGGNYTGTVNFSARADFQITGAFANSYNVTLYCNASGGGIDRGANSVKVATISNSSATTTLFENALVSISGLTDGMTYNCSAYADNYTTQRWINTAPIGGTSNSSGITFDSTSPSCSMSRNYPIIHKTGPQILTWSITDAVSLVSNSAYIGRPSPGTQLSYTDVSATSLLFAGLNTTYVGNYTANAYGKDRAGNVCNSTTNWLADELGGTVSVTDGIVEKKPNRNILLVAGGIILVIFLLSKKK